MIKGLGPGSAQVSESPGRVRIAKDVPAEAGCRAKLLVVLRGQMENPRSRLAAAISAYIRGRATPGEPRPAAPLSSIGVQRQLTAEQWEELRVRYQAGATVRALARDYGLHRTTVSEHLHAAGVHVRLRKVPEELIDRAVELYNRGYPLARAAQQIGCDAETLRQAFIRRGIPRRGPHDRPEIAR